MKSKRSAKEKPPEENEGKKERVPAPDKKSLIRILNEYVMLKDLSKSSKTFRKFKYSSDSMLKWNAVLMPQKEPYKKAAWRVQFQMPPNYPESPPKLKFLTPIYHPNVSKSGDVKLDILDKKKWNENVTMTEIVRTLQSTLTDPKQQAKDNKLVLNKGAAQNVKCCRCSFNRKAKSLAKKQAIKRVDPKKHKSKKDKTKNDKPVALSAEKSSKSSDYKSTKEKAGNNSIKTEIKSEKVDKYEKSQRIRS